MRHRESSSMNMQYIPYKHVVANRKGGLYTFEPTTTDKYISATIAGLGEEKTKKLWVPLVILVALFIGLRVGKFF